MTNIVHFFKVNTGGRRSITRRVQVIAWLGPRVWMEYVVISTPHILRTRGFVAGCWWMGGGRVLSIKTPNVRARWRFEDGWGWWWGPGEGSRESTREI